MARGFKQRENVDYTEVFSLVLKHTSIWVLLVLVAVRDLHLEQMNVKTTLFYGGLDEPIYMRQPLRYKENMDGKETVCLVRKFFYGVIQLPRI